MTNEPDVLVRPYRPGDREQVMAIAPRLNQWVAAWRDPDAVLAAVRGWVRGSVAASWRFGRAWSGAGSLPSSWPLPRGGPLTAGFRS
jgi:hypothetical protein